MPYVPTMKERIEDAQRYFLPVICGLIIAGVGGWAAWRYFKPEKPKAVIAAVATEEDKARAARQRSHASDVAALEKAYQGAVAKGASHVVLDSLLTRAINRQDELLRLEPHATGPAADQLARLETLRGDLRAKTMTAESRALEQAADEALSREENAEGIRKLREALRLQRDANKAARTPELVNLPREVRLAKIVEETNTGTLRTTVAAARIRAEAAVAAQDWPAALQAYERARAAQVEINARTSDNRSANLATLEQLDTEIITLQASALAAKLTATETAAAAALEAGKSAEAGATYAVAARQQEELNVRYPKSRFASPAKLAELVASRETAFSREAWGRAGALEREVTSLLRRRQAAAAGGKIAEAAALIAKTAAEFPRSQALDAGLRRKFEYLDLRRTGLETLQAQIDATLAPLPDSAGLRVLRTEVPQELYERVMNANPSRNPGRMLPVDSVSWQDARDFCERVSWLLGATARLPREDEFRALWRSAAGEPVWSADNSSGRSHEAPRGSPAGAGVQNLAGNLAEWLESAPAGGDNRPIAGGSFLDPATVIARLPIVMVEPRTRARHIGFRFVIETGAVP